MQRFYRPVSRVPSLLHHQTVQPVHRELCPAAINDAKPWLLSNPARAALSPKAQRCFSQTHPPNQNHAASARALNQKGIDEQVAAFDDAIEEEREKQVRAPWHREGTDQPPVKRQRSAGAMTKGIG